MNRKALTLVFALLASVAAGEKPGPGAGEVHVPLSDYADLVRRAEATPRTAPATYAFGKGSVSVTLAGDPAVSPALVHVDVAVQVLESEWTLVPILPPGTALTSATVSGSPLTLVHTPRGLSWATNSVGTHGIALDYSLPVTPSTSGFSIAVPVPEASSTELVALLPGSGLDVAVIPAATVRTIERGDQVEVRAQIPATTAIQISWRPPTKVGYALSRARYKGEVDDEAVRWRASLTIEMFTTDALTLPLFPRTITLSDLEVDGKQAPVLIEGDRFATLVRGRGTHEIIVRFEVPVVRTSGPPRVELAIPEIPVSQFELSLPGKKEISVLPAAAVTHTASGERTLATAFLPMTSSVAITWVEALPEEVRAEMRANANIYHTIHAEEGVLQARATAVYEITRGETNVIDLTMPADAQVNRILSSSGAVSDWRRGEPAGDGAATVSVFLDRRVKGEITFDIYYEKLVSTRSDAEPFTVPLVRAAEAHRQRGMIALLASAELALEPITADDLSRVGENQLPPFVRDQVKMTIAHTYKYSEERPQLSVRAVAPEKKRGRFDAEVDTLVSIGEVTLKGAATVELNVKSGSLMELGLRLPAQVSVLGLSGPSLRRHEVKPDGDHQRIAVEFTQEMDGQFRLEVSYEHILAEGADHAVMVPTVSVEGAEVEHGRIAVEALTAVEVQPAATEQLSSVDVNDLPQQLVLKTTNPILLAYKYAHNDPPYRLSLAVTRHRQIDVKAAAIEEAHYRTLYIRDGLAVTRAILTVRNSRKQFLKIELPPESEVWEVFVDGKPEKPAAAGAAGEDLSSVLIKMVSSTAGFPVELVYATRTARIGSIGTIEGVLPRPDMITTHSRWDVFLPAGVTYKKPRTNMDIVDEGSETSRDEMKRSLGEVEDRPSAASGQPALRISVPAQGILYSFEKLYANQSDENTEFSIAYAAVGGERFARFLVVLATALIWTGGLVLGGMGIPLARPRALIALGAGLVLLVFALWVLDASPTPIWWASGGILVVLGLAYAKERWEKTQQRRSAPPRVGETEPGDREDAP